MKDVFFLPSLVLVNLHLNSAGFPVWSFSHLLPFQKEKLRKYESYQVGFSSFPHSLNIVLVMIPLCNYCLITYL